MTHATDCPCEDCEALRAAQTEWQPVPLPRSILEVMDQAFAAVHNPAPGNPHWYTIVWFNMRRAPSYLNNLPLDFLRAWINAVDATEKGVAFGAEEDAAAELVKTRDALEKSERQLADLRHDIHSLSRGVEGPLRLTLLRLLK